MHGDDGSHRVVLLGAAGLEEDGGEAGQRAVAGGADAADDVRRRALVRRPVVVDEVGLLRLDEAVVLGEQEAEAVEDLLDAAELLRQHDVREVELPERRGARERREVEAERARRILRPPPGLERDHVAQRSAAPRPRTGRPRAASARKRRGPRTRASRQARGRRPRPTFRTRATASTRDSPPPRRGRRRLLRWPARPARTTTYRRRHASARSVQVRLPGSKCPASASRYGRATRRE